MSTANPTNVGNELVIFQMRKYKSLFKDDEAYATFLCTIRNMAVAGSLSVMLDDDQIICGMFSPQGTQEALRSRIVARLMQNPKELDLIQERLQDESIVKYGTFE